jgi:hypothetical protein
MLDRLRRANLAQHGLCDHDLAEQVDPFVLGFEVAGQGAVAFADLAQQVLRLEFAQVQLTEQVEQRRSILQHFLARGLRGRQRGYFQCDHIIDTVVFAAICFI